MSRSFTVEVTPEIIRDATKQFIWRHFRWSGVFTLVAGLLLVGYFLNSGSYDWLSGCLSGLLLAFVAIFVAAYFIRLRHGMALLQRMGDAKVHYELTDDGFSASSTLGSTNIRWDAMRGIWKLPTCWLLFFDRAAYVTIPLKGPSKDDLDFIASKIISHDREIK